jgi:hypothetical protein
MSLCSPVDSLREPTGEQEHLWGKYEIGITPGLSDRARRNRNLLAQTIGDAGFINYPTEWCSQSSSSVQLGDR